ncbi:MAG: hypothetical protein D6794_12675, partial [Deltaproteobacteria bacterium]
MVLMRFAFLFLLLVLVPSPLPAAEPVVDRTATAEVEPVVPEFPGLSELGNRQAQVVELLRRAQADVEP